MPLVSPGVDVQIIDESFYASAGAGTIPLIVIATASNKIGPSGSGTAPFTEPSRAGELFLATSQRELIQNFGIPKFYEVQGTPLHGFELNEYGLHAAYQFLGLANRAYVVRADVDLAQLEASDGAPRGEPLPGTYWLDLTETEFGIFRSNGSALPGAAWEPQKPLLAAGVNVFLDAGIYRPLAAFGTNGNFAVVVSTPVSTKAPNRIFEKVSGAWYEVGKAEWQAARGNVVTGTVSPVTLSAPADFSINGVTVNLLSGDDLAAAVLAINDATIANIVASISNNALVITNSVGGPIVLVDGNGTPLASVYGIAPGTYASPFIVRTNDAQYPSGSRLGDVWVKGTEPNLGANWRVKVYDATIKQWIRLSAPLYVFNSALLDGDTAKDTQAFTNISTAVAGVVYIGFDTAEGVQVPRVWTGTRWEDLNYEASLDAPATAPNDGTLWYNADFRVDVMVGDGTKWTGYNRRYPQTNPQGVILSGSRPVVQSDGTPLVDNDLWIDTTDIENYPALYRYDTGLKRWRKVDVTDQTTPFGVVFSDARENSGVDYVGNPNDGDYVYDSEEIEDMLRSDWVDPDAPDPRLFPDGMILFNTRYSTYNVKVWRPSYFTEGQFDPNVNYESTEYTVGDPTRIFGPLLDAGRWVTISGNKVDGSPWMGRKAQRAVIIRQMSAAINGNADLRSELVFYNLMAAPGYPEMIDELILLNVEQKEVAFVVGDTPPRLKPSGNEVQAWASNARNAPSNGEEGLTSSSPYCGVYYPWGLGTNIDGQEVMIPPSTIALHTIAFSDQVSFPWFAPAGFTRGLVTVATSVGFLTEENEYKPVLLNPGQRDVLYLNKINPIAFIPGRGLAVYGQKTLNPVDSALDRINVARLANYLKYNLDNLMKVFLFEPNDQFTRDRVKSATERFIDSIVAQRGIEDYVVICDETNNTPQRRDRNELWVDILVQPVKAIEFIYVPVRIRNSGDSLQLT